MFSIPLEHPLILLKLTIKNFRVYYRDKKKHTTFGIWSDSTGQLLRLLGRANAKCPGRDRTSLLSPRRQLDNFRACLVLVKKCNNDPSVQG